MNYRFALALASALAFQWPIGLPAQEAAAHDHAPGAHLNERLGKVTFPNSGARPAQASFLRGLALLHSFEYEDAADSFREAQRADAAFAVAYWGEALTYAKLLWGLDDPTAARAALARLGATREARLKLARTDRERAYGAAVEALYDNADLQTRVRGYVAGLRALNARHPNDLEARALLSIALQMGGAGYAADERKERRKEAIALAQSIFDAQPDHPGGAHYLIHATDNPEFAALGLAAARAYAKIAPDAEHALHMPSHIFVQIGAWDDVVASNERAWAASRAWVKGRGVANTQLSFHTLWWLQYGYLQQGRYREARALMDTVRAVLAGIDWAKSDAIDARYALDAFRFTYARETGDWLVYGGRAPRIVPPPSTASSRAESFAFTDAYGVAFATGVLRDTVTANAIAQSFTGTGPLQAVARAQIAALRAQARGDVEQYVASLREAALADAQVVHFGPPGLYPGHELLGNALLAIGRHQEALEAFQKSLELMPGRSASLLGLARAQRAAGQIEASRKTYAKLRTNWHAADPDLPALQEAGT
ncbi:MAG: tetratricopeptide repeat protein [Gemmatimonadaceae bacterium]|nr:tetratricopeptide repeat protein [Gemmatimonadaceae bacterium]